jgi:pyruvate/2-oxoglutarate dehydrogenase complex dihydrolipoamide acyltransferase (E2) component
VSFERAESGRAGQSSSDSANEQARPDRRYEGYDAPNLGEQPGGDEPDVLLDVPVLNVEELNLEVEDLKAHVSLRAELADLVKINVGVDVELGKINLDIKGLEAQALLKVRLERILGTLDRALEAIEKSPQILDGVVRSVSQAAQDAGQTPQLTEGTTRQGGGTTEQADQAAGTPPDETVEETATGNLADLQIEEEYVDEQGRIVGRARDEAGNVVEETLDEEGNVPERAEDPEAEGAVSATDAARKKARELGVRLSEVEGTGSRGRILVGDVEKAAR